MCIHSLKLLLLTAAAGMTFAAAGAVAMDKKASTDEGTTMSTESKMKHSTDHLTPLQKKVTMKGGTEAPFENKYWDNKKDGIYVDIIDGTPLFSSHDKFDSGTGWPSFTKPISAGAVTEHDDESLYMKRTEIKASTTDSHLGHVVTDGPKDQGGLRYCMNSASLRFIPKEDLEKEGYGEYLKLFDPSK